MDTTKNKMKRVFLDLDGVLVNFHKGYEDRVNEREPGYLEKIGYDGDIKKLEGLIQLEFERVAPNEKQRAKAKYRAGDKFWSFIIGDADWWKNLEWMIDGQELFDTVYMMRQQGFISELSILSAPSKTDPIVPLGKQQWLEKNNIHLRVDRIIMENDKYKYAENSNDILIDDTPKKLDDWANAGGTPLLHTSTNKSLIDLCVLIRRDNS